MKVTYHSSPSLSFEFEGTIQKEIFAELASIAEIFSIDKCGACGSENIRPQVRVVDDNEYHELVCQDRKCRAKLAFGVAKKGGKIFPKRKDKDGKYLENDGWVKWQGTKQPAKSAPVDSDDESTPF